MKAMLEALTTTPLFENSVRLSHQAAERTQILDSRARVHPAFFSAFALPVGAPDPAAPPCIRQRRFPATAGA